MCTTAMTSTGNHAYTCTRCDSHISWYQGADDLRAEVAETTRSMLQREWS